MGEPVFLGLFVGPELIANAEQNAQVVERMNLAGDHVRQGAHTGTAVCILGQKRRLRMGLVEPFHDGERLRQKASVFSLKRRHKALRVLRQIRGRAGFSVAQHVRDIVKFQPLEVQRGAEPR